MKIFVERILYDEQFVERAISKAQVFYFDVFLPSILSCTIISQDNLHITEPTEILMKKSFIYF